LDIKEFIKVVEADYSKNVIAQLSIFLKMGLTCFAWYFIKRL